MAEEKKVQSKGQKRYGSGPKITDADKSGETMKDGVAAAAKSDDKKTTTSSNEADAAKPGDDPGPTPEESSGTDGIPVHEVQSQQIKDMHTRHEKERRDMHSRHEQEHKTMLRAHAKASKAQPEKDDSDG